MGEKWIIFLSLEDLDFADDVALLKARSHEGQNKWANKLLEPATGLKRNASKMKETHINSKSPQNLKNTMDLEKMDGWSYLGFIMSP